MTRTMKIFSVVVALGLILAGFGTQAWSKTFLTVGTGPTGGAFYPIGGGVADIINQNIKDVSAKVEVTGGAKANCNLVGSQKSDLGITNGNVAYFALEGMEPFKKKLPLRAIGNIHPSVFQPVVPAESAIKGFSDLKGKKVAVGPGGSSCWRTFKQVLSLYDINYDTDIKPSYLPWHQGSEQVKDGHVDAAVYMAGAPSGAITSLAVTKPIRLLGLDADKKAVLKERFPYYGTMPLKAGTYKGQKEVLLVKALNVLFVNISMDEELAYAITKAVYTNLDKLKTYHGAAKKIDLKTAHDTPIPLHPGSARFWREKGHIK